MQSCVPLLNRDITLAPTHKGRNLIKQELNNLIANVEPDRGVPFRAKNKTARKTHQKPHRPEDVGQIKHCCFLIMAASCTHTAVDDRQKRPVTEKSQQKARPLPFSKSPTCHTQTFEYNGRFDFLYPNYIRIFWLKKSINRTSRLIWIINRQG